MARHNAAAELGRALARGVRGAEQTRWNTTGIVAAVAGNLLTVTIDGATVEEVTRLASYSAPAQGDVVLVAIVRGSRSIQYTAVGKIAV